LRQAASPSATPQAPAQSVSLRVEVFAKNLQVPWAIERTAEGRFFTTERAGRIRIIKDGILQAEPWMTLPVTEVGEAGLLGLALDPQFSQNHFVYVAYSYRDGIRLLNRLVRLREDSNGKGIMDKVLIDGVSANVIHDGGRVKFGPDGKLYWTMGEANDRPVAQDVKALNGKILRLNTDGSIPGDNPFPNSYVYSYGHRNPQGLAWQPGTNRLYETEHGPSGVAPDCCRDEVNLIEPGKNYGWPEITGDQTRAGIISPILQSGNNTTWAPSGATFVTQGSWAGSLLFAGLRGESLYRLTLDKNDPRKVVSFERLLQNEYGRLRDVYETPDGAIYVLTNNRDGRGQPSGDDDRILKLTFK
jgi:glucose/arabinose dehydrogenase